MCYPKQWSKGLAVLVVVMAALVNGLGTKNGVIHAATLGSKLHVTAVLVGWDYNGASKQPYAFVFIEDEFGNPVNGALVKGNWSGCNTMRGASGTTQTFYNDDGTVRFDGVTIVLGRKHACLKGNCYFTFTVTNVSMPGRIYDAASNVTTSGSTACNPLGP